MNCLLNNFIGIEGCSSTAPKSGLYINSLPSISLKSFDRLTDEESPTYIQVWTDIQLRASKRFQIDIYRELNKRWKISTVTNSIDLGRNILSTATPLAAEYRGIYRDLDYGYDNQIKKSALQTNYLQSLSFYSPLVQSITIEVFDMDLQVVLDTYAFASVVGWNVVQVNKNYLEHRIAIVVDSTAINSRNLIIPSSAQYKCDVTKGIRFDIAAGQPNFATTVYGDNSFGLSAVFGTRCRWDSLVCNNLDLFAESFWYLCGAETAFEGLTSNRVNFVTTDKKKLDLLRGEFNDNYLESLSQAALNINMDMADDCIECNELLTVKETDAFCA